MTAPQSFEVEEVEGADLGQVAGVKRVCDTCGGDSWTGRQCTACFVATIPTVSRGPYSFAPVAAVVEVERAEVRPPEWVRELDWRVDPDLPRPALQLGLHGADAGWRVKVVWSRGWEPRGSHVEMITVRFSHPTVRRGAYGAYRRLVREGGALGSWTWDSLYVWGYDLPPFGGCSLADLKEYLAGQAGWDSMELETWATGIRGGRSDAAEARAKREEDKKHVRSLHAGGMPVGRLLLADVVKRNGWTVEDVRKIVAPRARAGSSKKNAEAS